MLRQAFAHCAIFPTAASRRSLGRVSVPVWPVALSGRLPVVALVSHYLTNKLIGRESIPDRKTFQTVEMPLRLVSGISSCFQLLFQSLGQVTHVLLTRSPLIHPASWASPFDLHVLSTPPAFILSQDQTLRKEKMHTPSGKRRSSEFELTKEILIADYPLPTPKCRTLIQRNLCRLRRHEVNWHLTSARC